MDIWQILLDVVILLGAGALLGGLFERAGQSALVGYLLAGALLGPTVTQVIQNPDEVLAVSEIGVALLLFAIGLEFSWARLRGMGRVALNSGVLQVVATTAIGVGVASAVGLGVAASLTLGAICALSSTAGVMRVLAARGEVESAHGERALGILLVQDLAVVPFVLVVSVLADGGTAREVAVGVLRAGGIGLALVAALYVTFHSLVPRLLGSGPINANRELPLLIAIVSGLGSGVVAHAVGVSPALGAFVAGVVLAESPFALQVRADVSSLKTLFLTLFFAAMGMLSDPMWIASNALLVGAAVASVVCAKVAIIWALLRFFETRGRTALATGICLGQIGEFSFVLADIARGTILDEQMFLLVVSTAVITMFLTPSLVGYAPRLASRLTRTTAPTLDEVTGGAADATGGIVIGFGPAGRAAAERVAELGWWVMVVDENLQAARDARSLGYGAVTGDARYPEVLEQAGLPRASFVAVTVPGTETAVQIVRYVRLHARHAQILVRARFHRSLVELEAAGADVIVDEEHEVGRQLAKMYEELTGRSGQDAPPAVR